MCVCARAYVCLCVCMHWQLTVRPLIPVARVTAVLGYLPQDLIGQMCYEYFHPDDIRKMVELFHEGAWSHR